MQIKVKGEEEKRALEVLVHSLKFTSRTQTRLTNVPADSRGGHFPLWEPSGHLEGFAKAVVTRGSLDILCFSHWYIQQRETKTDPRRSNQNSCHSEKQVKQEKVTLLQRWTQRGYLWLLKCDPTDFADGSVSLQQTLSRRHFLSSAY